MKKLFVLVLFILLVTNCSETVPPTNDNFVVEGFVTADFAVDNIKVKMTSPVNATDISNAPIANATVVLSDVNGEYVLDYDPATEKYAYNGNDLNVATGQSLSLEVRSGDRTATAQTLVPEPPTGLVLTDNVITIPQLNVNIFLPQRLQDLFQTARINLTWDAVEGQKYFVVIEHKEPSLDPILPDQIPDETQELIGQFRFITEPSENAEFEIIGLALQTYGLHVAKVFSVNQEYADLFDNLEQDSRDLNEPPSNVFNALGIFTAFAVDSLEFEVRR